MRRLVVVSALAAIAVLGTASPTLACAPYTFDDDGFGLERGIAWAFEGHVDRAVPGEAGQGPDAIVITVDRTLAGVAAGAELSIAQDDGCDGFHYGPGDEVIVAIPRYSGFVAEISVDDRIVPPYAGVTNYTVAVWVLEDDRVLPGDGPHSWPTIGGIRPQTAADVIEALVALPDTATQRLPTDGTSWPALALILLGAFALELRRTAPRRSARGARLERRRTDRQQ